MMRIIIYVLESIEAGKRYVGITNNLPRRLAEHRSKRTKAGQLLGKFRLLHTESSSNYTEARLREKYFKSSTGRRWLNKALTPRTARPPLGDCGKGENQCLTGKISWYQDGEGCKVWRRDFRAFLRSMKRGFAMTTYRHIIFRITTVAFLAAFLTFISGCVGGDTSTGNPEFDKALDDMKFENAPTLGPVARKYLVAIFKGEWEKAWDMMSSKVHKTHAETWEYEKNWAPDEIKEMANKAGSAKEYYILTMKKTEKSEEEWVKEITKEKEKKGEVTGEEFSDDGKTGLMKAKNLKTGKEVTMGRLIKEGGEWKIGN